MIKDPVEIVGRVVIVDQALFTRELVLLHVEIDLHLVFDALLPSVGLSLQRSDDQYQTAYTPNKPSNHLTQVLVFQHFIFN